MCFEESVVDLLIEELYKSRDVVGILMVQPYIFQNECFIKLIKYREELEIEYEKEGIVSEKYFNPRKYHTKNDQLLQKQFSAYSAGFNYKQQRSRYLQSKEIPAAKEMVIPEENIINVPAESV